MAMRTRVSVLLLLPFAGLELAAASIPTVDTILARMAAARAENRTHLRPYSVTRNYRLIGQEKQTTRSEVIASVSFVPPDYKQFVIEQAKGMRLGERIVRQMLEHETEIVKDYGSTDMSPANYDFRFLRAEELDGRPCYVLQMKPHRKDKTLLRGQIWVDATTFLLHRIDGEPGKAPSWWLRDSRIVLSYGYVGDMWLQTASESSADVRFIGRHTMLSRDVEYKISQLAAATASTARLGQ